MNQEQNPQLRAATNADASAVQSLVFSVLTEYGLIPDPEGTDVDLCDLESSYRGRGGAFGVLEAAGGRILGCVGLLPLDQGTCELRKMYLLPEARGRGLGRRLLEASLRKAKEMGFHRVVLESATVLKEAISLYERYGFKPYTPEHMSKRCNRAYSLDLAGYSSAQGGGERPNS